MKSSVSTAPVMFNPKPNDIAGNNKVRILLGQLNNLGDCLLATAVARQIKHDFPDSVLTWAIGSCCRQIIHNNPYVDKVWEVLLPDTKKETIANVWKTFATEANRRKEAGDFDLVFFTQYSYGHLDNHMGLTRASIFAGYPKEVTVPVAPVVRLTAGEVENVRRFAAKHVLHRFKKTILFECIGTSGQSFLTDEFIEEFCGMIAADHPDVCLILSSNKKFGITAPNVVDGSQLSFRENAELTKYCSLFIGVSSGITWLCTADSAKDLPKIILLNKEFPQASVVFDHSYFRLNGSRIFEANACTPQELITLINQEALPKTPKNVRLFEAVCFYTPTMQCLDKWNIRKIIPLFLKAPSLKIKLRILWMVTRYSLGKIRANVSRSLVAWAKR